MSVSTSALGGAHERGLSGGEQIISDYLHNTTGCSLARRESSGLSHLPFRHVFGVSRLSSPPVPLGLTVLRFSCVLWVDKHSGIAGTFSPAPRCEPTPGITSDKPTSIMAPR